VLPIDELFDSLPADVGRQDHPFSADMEECQTVLFDPALSRQRKADALNEWIGSEALPCMFARFAAKTKRFSYCILTEFDLRRGDDYVREVIALDKLNWQREAVNGSKHAFVILVASKRLAFSEPGAALLQLAQRLCQLYCLDSTTNAIIRDRLYLQLETSEGTMEGRKWDVGINFHAAQGDGRWWHDHRIPGGIGFSMNSVGHMSRVLAEEARKKSPQLAERTAGWPAERLVTWALPLAMNTIRKFSEGNLAGTWLVAEASDSGSDSSSHKMPQRLADYSADRYQGWYHTDQTIPEEFFHPRWERPSDLKVHDLQFQYLHRPHHEEYPAMALGEVAEILELYEALRIEKEG
jgi:hypothetical protein